MQSNNVMSIDGEVAYTTNYAASIGPLNLRRTNQLPSASYKRAELGEILEKYHSLILLKMR